jgi:hypothetical protein
LCGVIKREIVELLWTSREKATLRRQGQAARPDSRCTAIHNVPRRSLFQRNDAVLLEILRTSLRADDAGCLSGCSKSRIFCYTKGSDSRHEPRLMWETR